jgi:putative aldouronate transport system permease protein
MKLTTGEKIFNVFNLALLSALTLSMLYPFVYCLSMSLSSAAAANQGGFHFFPTDLSLAAYQAIFSDPNLISGYANSMLRTAIGVPATVFCCALCAYPLSRRAMPFRKPATLFVLFTMLFGGGLVPTYLLYHHLGLLDNRMVYILPGLMQAFSVILIKNYFQSVPESLHEAADIDGASEWYIFLRIYLPLSKPILATVAMFSAIGHWNAWFDSMLFMTSESKMVVQTFLQRIVVEGSMAQMDPSLAAQVTDFTPETIKAATVIVTLVPLLILYPFVQKHFTKGIMLGGVKE